MYYQSVMFFREHLGWFRLVTLLRKIDSDDPEMCLAQMWTHKGGVLSTVHCLPAPTKEEIAVGKLFGTKEYEDAGGIPQNRTPG